MLCLIVLVLVPGSSVWTASSAAPTEGHCEEARTAQGETATMTFTLRKDIDTTSPSFYAFMRRKSFPLTDIISCDGVQIASGKECEVKETYPMFQVTNSLEGNRLTVEISNMSRDLEDTYVLKVFANQAPEPAISCTLSVTDTLADTRDAEDKTDKLTVVMIVVPVVATVIAVVAAAIVIIKRRKREKKHPNQDCEGKDVGTEMALLDKTDGWYHEEIGESRAEKLLKSSMYRSGAFLVMCRTNGGSKEYIIKAKFSKKIHTYRIRHGSKGYWIEKDVFHTTVQELIKYYTYNAGCLPKPLSVSPRKQQRGPDDPSNEQQQQEERPSDPDGKTQ